MTEQNQSIGSKFAEIANQKDNFSDKDNQQKPIISSENTALDFAKQANYMDRKQTTENQIWD